ncbi:hypothetical protein D3C77_452940 [compost metagenome]
MLHRQAVDGPLICLVRNLPFEFVFAKRVFTDRFQRVHPVILILSVVRREINVPFSADILDFRGPEVRRVHRSNRRVPDHLLLRLLEINRSGFHDHDICSVMGERHVIISILVYNARIGGVHLDQRIFERTPASVVFSVRHAAVRLSHRNHSYYDDYGDA